MFSFDSYVKIRHVNDTGHFNIEYFTLQQRSQALKAKAIYFIMRYAK